MSMQHQTLAEDFPCLNSIIHIKCAKTQFSSRKIIPFTKKTFNEKKHWLKKCYCHNTVFRTQFSTLI